MSSEEGTRPDAGSGGGPRRVAVFIDYWWVYSSARQLFGGGQAPPWFGNVSLAPLARVLVKRPPAAVRRSQRVAAGVHVFIRSYDPELHHGQHERVQRWQAEGATVDVGPARDQGVSFWQAALDVSLATAVTDALDRGDCDTAVIFAGDAGLLPLVRRMAGPAVPSASIELATWVAPNGSVPTPLAGVDGVWCHRLGEATFKQLSDDRRPARAAAAKARRAAAAEARRAAKPPTAMAAALAAVGMAERAEHKESEIEVLADPPTPDLHAAEERRGFTQRLFGRGA